MDRSIHPLKPSVVEAQRSALLQMTRLLDMTQDAVMVCDLDGMITYWNKGAAEQYGWESPEVLGKPLADLLRTSFPVPRPAIEAALQAAGHWQGLLHQQHRDGKLLPVESRWELFHDEHGKPNAILHLDRHVPSPMAASASPTNSEQAYLLNDLLQNLPGIFVFLDTHWVYRLVTHHSARLVGRKVEDMLGRHYLEVFPGNERYMEAMHQQVCLEGKTVTQLGAQVLLPTGDGQTQETFWDYTLSPVYDRHGVLIGFMSLGFEVSQRVQLERELAQHTHALEKANRELKAVDRYKDEFLSVVSHELKTPLNFIMGFASILADEVNGTLNDDQHLSVQRILEGATRMLELISDLLDLGQIAADKVNLALSEASIDDLVNQVTADMRPLAEKRDLCLESEVLLHGPVLMDPRRIAQVLKKLIGNAIKFTPPGGRVQVRVIRCGPGVRIEVLDTGPGIEPDDLPKLFAPFKQLDMSPTRQAGGTGIGLSIAKALVEAHHGRIGVDSVPGEGCRFWFELPLAAAEG